MLFSIIIPTYNPRNDIARLLDSIAHNRCLNEIEIIISDDQSTEPFSDIVDNYTNLNIKTIVNPYHLGFPRLGRQRGLSAATGQWVTFADQDDYFIDNSFDKIKTLIEENNVKNYFFTNIYIEWVDQNNEREIGNGTLEWTHGKFYEKTFLEKNNIQYHDLTYNEDIDFCIQIQCLLIEKQLDNLGSQDPIYVWRRRADSLSGEDYHLNMFSNYVQATLENIIFYMNKNRDNNYLYIQYKNLFLLFFLKIYFYFQYLPLFNQKDKILGPLLQIKKLYDIFNQILKEHSENIYEIIESNNFIYQFDSIRNFCFIQRPFIEQITLKQFLFVYLN